MRYSLGKNCPICGERASERQLSAAIAEQLMNPKRVLLAQPGKKRGQQGAIPSPHTACMRAHITYVIPRAARGKSLFWGSGGE